MKPLDAGSLLEHEDSPWFGVLYWCVDSNEARTWFEFEPYVSTHTIESTNYWAVELECGLRLIFELANQSPHGVVYASEPNAEHVRRHFPGKESQLADPPEEAFDREHVATISRFSDRFPELLGLKSFQVWRQGDDGNAMKVGTPTSKRDAECRVAEFEAHHHKQIYWVSRFAGP